MIALWMLYATVISTALGAAAAVVDRTAGSVIRSRRWIWVAAVVLSGAIPVTVALAPQALPGVQGSRFVRPVDSPPVAATSESSIIAARIADLLAKGDASVLERFDRPFAIGWGLAVLLAFAAYGAATFSLARRRRTWRSAVVDGEQVLLAPAVGPAVIGAVRPEIVVPSWSLDLAPDQRALMIEHERQHVRARDPLVLHATAMVAMLTPWNVALWWINRRLRLAVELDCDARVLAGGRDVRAYGTLLLDVCSRRRRPSAVLAPALLERTSSLTRRILAMQPTTVRFALPRAALGMALALGVVALACDMPTPEMLAPDGTNTPTTRVFGKAGAVVPLDGVHNIRRVVASYFPSIARGEGEPAILFVVRSSAGEILLTDSQAASAMARRPNGGRGANVRSAPTGSPSIRPRQRAPDQRQRSSARNTALPSGVGTIEPNDIEAVEISKHGAGVVAPKPVSLIVITLKAGAPVPTQVAVQ